MSADALFDGFDERQPDAQPMTAGERRRKRQAEKIAAGFHPLSTPKRVIRLAESGTCGECIHRRQINTGTSKSYPKCIFDRPKRMTNGEATDVKAAWPACVDFEDHG